MPNYSRSSEDLNLIIPQLNTANMLVVQNTFQEQPAHAALRAGLLLLQSHHENLKTLNELNIKTLLQYPAEAETVAKIIILLTEHNITNINSKLMQIVDVKSLYKGLTLILNSFFPKAHILDDIDILMQYPTQAEYLGNIMCTLFKWELLSPTYRIKLAEQGMHGESLWKGFYKMSLQAGIYGSFAVPANIEVFFLHPMYAEETFLGMWTLFYKKQLNDRTRLVLSQYPAQAQQLAKVIVKLQELNLSDNGCEFLTQHLDYVSIIILLNKNNSLDVENFNLLTALAKAQNYDSLTTDKLKAIKTLLEGIVSYVASGEEKDFNQGFVYYTLGEFYAYQSVDNPIYDPNKAIKYFMACIDAMQLPFAEEAAEDLAALVYGLLISAEQEQPPENLVEVQNYLLDLLALPALRKTSMIESLLSLKYNTQLRSDWSSRLYQRIEDSKVSQLFNPAPTATIPPVSAKSGCSPI